MGGQLPEGILKPMARYEHLFDRLRAGDRDTLARAITLVESSRPEDADSANELVELCMKAGPKALRLGVTGIPGVGKSTLIDMLGMAMIEQAHRVAVLAIDPSSSRSGGSILGDKTRMQRLTQHEAAFVRPTATQGSLGGTARRTRETIVLCEAAGYDRILVETVGTGQNELDVDRMTDLTLLLLLAGTGDDLQGIKRGIMEIADLIAFTKADGDGAERALAAGRQLIPALNLLPPRDSGRRPEVLAISATVGTGIAGLVARIEALHAEDAASGRKARRRSEQALHWLHMAITDELLGRFKDDPRINERLPALERMVGDGKASPFRTAQELVRMFRTGDEPRP